MKDSVVADSMVRELLEVKRVPVDSIGALMKSNNHFTNIRRLNSRLK
jgi:hypothetical protein